MRVFAIGAIVFALDQISKMVIQQKMYHTQSLPIIADIFHITYIRNPGAAFGILAYRTGFFIFISVVVVTAIFFYLPRVPANRWLLRFGLALQMGGVLGNLADRLRFGYVVDFLDFRIWPVFNLADSAIVIGVAILCWELLTVPDPLQRNPEVG